MKKVGVIGLGNMGMGIAKNLIKDGYETTGFDLRESCLKELINNLPQQHYLGEKGHLSLLSLPSPTTIFLKRKYLEGSVSHRQSMGIAVQKAVVLTHLLART